MTVLSSVHNSKECYPILQQPTPTHWKKNLQVNFLYCLNYSLLLIYQDENSQKSLSYMSTPVFKQETQPENWEVIMK